jgi:hypothetical protein
MQRPVLSELSVRPDRNSGGRRAVDRSVRLRDEAAGLSGCRVCGERLPPSATACPICLEPRQRAPRVGKPWRRRLGCYLLPLLFVGSWVAFLPLGTRLAEPMTHVAVRAVPDRAFLVVVMDGDVPRVSSIGDVTRIPAPPEGASYLIPAGQERVVEARLNADAPRDADGRWVLSVKQVAVDRQHIELYRMNDGYWGNGYEATPSSITPRYRKITGPGFAFVVGRYALLLNAAVWAGVALVFWLARYALRARRKNTLPQ